jgi:hypothetical protein
MAWQLDAASAGQRRKQYSLDSGTSVKRRHLGWYSKLRLAARDASRKYFAVVCTPARRDCRCPALLTLAVLLVLSTRAKSKWSSWIDQRLLLVLLQSAM